MTETTKYLIAQCNLDEKNGIWEVINASVWIPLLCLISVCSSYSTGQQNAFTEHTNDLSSSHERHCKVAGWPYKGLLFDFI